jgi:beta-glucosidase/6-phospho-beta-glucosidase/beta-galactosidase
MYKILKHVHETYGAPPIWVTENGCSAPGEAGLEVEKAARDAFRLRYYAGYIDEMLRAVGEGGCVVRVCFALFVVCVGWSLLRCV